MAIGRKTGGRNFQPGNPGGPGRPPVPPDIVKARRINRAELERILNSIIFLNPQEVKDLIADPKTSVIERLVAAIVVKGIQGGSPFHLEFILTRLIGRVTEQIELASREPFIVELHDGKQIITGHEIKEVGGDE